MKSTEQVFGKKHKKTFSTSEYIILRQQVLLGEGKVAYGYNGKQVLLKISSSYK